MYLRNATIGFEHVAVLLWRMKTHRSSLPPVDSTTTRLLLVAASLLLTCATHVMSAATPCPPCGNTTVPFPLSTTSTCGDPLYKIRCNTSTGTLMLDTLNSSYPIESINPKAQRFTIRPAPLIQDTCVSTDKVHEGIQLNSTLPFNITSSNTIVYLNCTRTLLQSPLNCSAASACHAYINATASAAACNSGPLCCTYRTGGSSNSYMIRVRDSGCRAYSSFVNLDSGLPVNRWPRPGLEIQWISPRETVCGSQVDCDAATSTCGSDASSSNGIKRCFCNDGLVWDPIQGVCTKSQWGPFFFLSFFFFRFFIFSSSGLLVCLLGPLTRFGVWVWLLMHAEITCQNPDGCDDSSNKAAIIAGTVFPFEHFSTFDFKCWKIMTYTWIYDVIEVLSLLDFGKINLCLKTIF